VITIQELKRWTDAVAKNIPNADVGLGEDCLTLEAKDADGVWAYYEIGGFPLDYKNGDEKADS